MGYALKGVPEFRLGDTLPPSLVDGGEELGLLSTEKFEMSELRLGHYCGGTMCLHYWGHTAASFKLVVGTRDQLEELLRQLSADVKRLKLAKKSKVRHELSYKKGCKKALKSLLASA